MLDLFLDHGAELSHLSTKQRRVVFDAFHLYLIHAIDFRACLSSVFKYVDVDAHDLRVVIKKRLANMIEDPHAVLVVKPAVLRLARGDASLFRAAGMSAGTTRALIKRYPKAFNSAIRAIKFDEDDLCERRIKELELEYTNRVRSHAANFAYRKTRFLCAAGSDRSLQDLTEDLSLIGIRTFRWYFPFRVDLHMLNTMRTSITNRGNSLIKFNTTDSRRRLIQLEDGDYLNRESSHEYDRAIQSAEGAFDPTRTYDLIRLLSRLSSVDRYQPVVKFVQSDELQSRFVGWSSHKLGVRLAGMEDLTRHVRENSLSYNKLLSRFMGVPTEDVRDALKVLRQAV